MSNNAITLKVNINIYLVIFIRQAEAYNYTKKLV